MSESCLLLGEFPTEIDISEGDSPFATESTNLRENFFNQVLPLFPYIAEGAADKEAERTILWHRCLYIVIDRA